MNEKIKDTLLTYAILKAYYSNACSLFADAVYKYLILLSVIDIYYSLFLYK